VWIIIFWLQEALLNEKSQEEKKEILSLFDGVILKKIWKKKIDFMDIF
jgi:hypothetical protein